MVGEAFAADLFAMSGSKIAHVTLSNFGETKVEDLLQVWVPAHLVSTSKSGMYDAGSPPSPRRASVAPCPQPDRSC